MSDDGGFIAPRELTTNMMTKLYNSLTDFKVTYANSSSMIVTEENCEQFDVPMLHARMIAARSLGKLLVIVPGKYTFADNQNGNITITDKDPDTVQVIDHVAVSGFKWKGANYISIGYNDPQPIEDECRPRNRAEFRHGRQKEKPIWEKDWRRK